MVNIMKKSIIIMLGIMTMLFMPMTVNATSSNGGTTSQTDMGGLLEVYQGARGMENKNENKASNAVKNAAKRFSVAITVAIVGGVIIVLVIIFKRQKGVRF